MTSAATTSVAQQRADTTSAASCARAGQRSAIKDWNAFPPSSGNIGTRLTSPQVTLTHIRSP